MDELFGPNLKALDSFKHVLTAFQFQFLDPNSDLVLIHEIVTDNPAASPVEVIQSVQTGREGVIAL
ncbi:hypothetical protein D9M68_960640 [compost metagenome]